MDHEQFKVSLKAVDKKFAYTICQLELTNLEVHTVGSSGAREGNGGYVQSTYMHCGCYSRCSVCYMATHVGDYTCVHTSYTVRMYARAHTHTQYVHAPTYVYSCTHTHLYTNMHILYIESY